MLAKKQVKPKIIFFGDSRADALLPAFNQISEGLGVAGIVTGYPACLPFLGLVSLRHDQDKFNRRVLNQRVLNFVKENDISTLVLAAHWTYYTNGATRAKTLGHLSAKLKLERKAKTTVGKVLFSDCENRQ